LKKKKEKIEDAVFIVTNEEACPYYDVGDEFIVENLSISISFKPVCIYLSENIREQVSQEQSFNRFPQLGHTKASPKTAKQRFDCGGCTGLIKFEYKQEKAYATLQMKMLRDASELRKKQHLQKFYRMMRNFVIFDPLEDESLKDLTLFLEFKTVLADKVLLKIGDPGNFLYIIIRGKVAVIDDQNSKILELGPGGLFGEKSLLAAEPEENAIHTLTGTQVAMLSIKNFRKIIKKHYALQIFLFKLLIERIQKEALMTGKINSGMTGSLEEIPLVDLMQMINSAQKTGTVEVSTGRENANIYFYQGEIVQAIYNQKQGKEALFSLMEMSEGVFNFKRGILDQYLEMPPIGGFIGLIMEGVQRIDEQVEE
jgi:CRP/FNR family cyclic AMP-dependent transcriptional regulator